MMQNKTNAVTATPPKRDLHNFDEFRKFLGPLASGYTEAQLRQLQREMFSMAELLLDVYLSKKQKRAASRLTDASPRLG